jgi:hypothetical protein
VTTPERVKLQQDAERDNPHLTPDEVQLLILSGQLSTAKVESDMDWGGAIAFAIIAILVAVATLLLR